MNSLPQKKALKKIRSSCKVRLYFQRKFGLITESLLGENQMNIKQLLTPIIALLIAFNSFGAEKHTKHTYKLSEGQAQPKANLQDVAWLAGSWQGSGFGSKFESVWNPESANTMVGMFKLYDEEKGVTFYEILLLTEENDSLALLVKHFSADFIAWESKEDFVKFKLVKLEDNAIHFSGLSFYKTGPDTMDGYIVIKYKDGNTKEQLLSYRRAKPIIQGKKSSY